MKKTLVFVTLLALMNTQCVSIKTDHKNTATPRFPTSTTDFFSGIDQLTEEFKNPNIFNAETCFNYIDERTTTLLNLPTEYFYPKNASEKAMMREKGPQYLQKIFNLRVTIREHLKKFVRDNTMTSKCLNALRESFQFIRYSEDFLIEWMVQEKMYSKDSPAILTNQFPYTLASPQYKNFKLEAGDIMIVRGKSYISAMIARIGDEESNFSHLAIVSKDAKGELYITEALIQYGAVQKKLSDWVKDQDARVALYRHPDRQLAERAARKIHDHVAGLKAAGKPIKYDFAMDDEDSSTFFCSEVGKVAYSLASNKKVILPYYRTQTTKFAQTNFFEDMGIKKGSMFAPSDMEMDPRFELVAEYRFLGLLKQVRLQDSVLQSMYSWMSHKNYDFHDDLVVKGKAMLGKIFRMFGLLADKFPTYMPPKTLETIMKYETVATALEKNIYSIDAEHVKNHGYSLGFKDMLKIHEDFRYKDCISELSNRDVYQKEGNGERVTSQFHWIYSDRKTKDCR